MLSEETKPMAQLLNLALPVFSVVISHILGSVPAAMQLRYLQTLTEIGAEQNSTVMFPMPLDLVKPFLQLIDAAASATATATATPAGLNGAGETG